MINVRVIQSLMTPICLCVAGFNAPFSRGLWLLRRRLRHSWLLLTVTSFGILASVTMMATGALYSRALGEAGLGHFLASFGAREMHNIQIIAQNRPLGQPVFWRSKAWLKSRMENGCRDAEGSGAIWADSGKPVIAFDTDLIDSGAPFGRPFFLTGFREHSSLRRAGGLRAAGSNE
ncbi:MAG: hypothetical protein Ct9H300mP11_13930 [Chloroflexota bacterium]|nr:MAG: hypothetical protein Ct9H300mP11_13930 [Chloroflexota bacterium]